MTLVAPSPCSVPGPARVADRLCAVVVVVPARDEAELVGRCLDALVAARARLAAVRPEVAVRLVVACDSCTDGTADEALAREGVAVVELDARSVGVARAAGVALGRADLADLDAAAVWLACTDADSAVPETWLVDQVRLAEEGADLVVGTVRPDGLTPSQAVRWARTHVPGRPNGHVHGANLGVRLSVHDAVGGFAPVAEHEDVVLVDRARDSGARLVASDVVEVLTSGRLVGRTPGGYAAHLAGSPWGA